ncbi:DUF3726 domain-containing protein [Leisingera sp. HS039]|uniref:DUF3726 domain-containing protein n=1 Tax=unclassified Leisingera TaxID=2614906 RepID=UPI001070E533|nr:MULTISPECIES: DUF3726 domain-containing protein [unclassified Leisingera]MBQ4827554.1 DUF3726 domain-containing protein [Leisingera sp. HS039]QBR37831.1 DUF3726 domain-containing protein [Leisingera sp. NJS201]
MKVSRNEMIAALSRAYEGAGHHIGDYEDAAQLVTWSQMCGLAGFDNIAMPPVGPKGGATPRLVFENKEIAVVDAGGAEVCEHGSLAADLAHTKARKSGFAVVQLANCRYPGLILRSLSLVAQQGVFIAAYWQDAAGSHGASFEAGAVFPNYWWVESPVGTEEVSTTTIICTDKPTLLADAVARQAEHPKLRRHEYSAAQLAANYGQSLEAGIMVPQAHWDALNASAWPILVATTEQSRAGAGPG